MSGESSPGKPASLPSVSSAQSEVGSTTQAHVQTTNTVVSSSGEQAQSKPRSLPTAPSHTSEPGKGIPT